MRPPHAPTTGSGSRREIIHQQSYTALVVRFENLLSNEDLERATKLTVTPEIMTGAAMSQLKAIEAFWTDMIHPYVHERGALPLRQLALASLGDRLIGHARVVPKLNSLVYQQTATAAERSVIELWLDIQLLHRNVFADGVERLFAFAEYQKLQSARRTVRFFAEHPHLDDSPSAALPHQTYVTANAARIDARTFDLWGTPGKKPPRPEHWSAMNVPDRAKRVSPEAQLLVLHGYDMRNFAVHSGVAGIMNVPATAQELVFVQSVANVAKCLLETLRIMGTELEISQVVEAYDGIVDYLDDLMAYAVSDAALRLQGEPQRLFFRPGPWSVAKERSA